MEIRYTYRCFRRIAGLSEHGKQQPRQNGYDSYNDEQLNERKTRRVTQGGISVQFDLQLG